MELLYKKNMYLELYNYIDVDLGCDMDNDRFISFYMILLSLTLYKISSLVEYIWLRYLIEGVCYQINKLTILYCDNQSTLKLVTNLIYQTRTNHIKIKHHFILKIILQEIIEVIEIKSKYNHGYIYQISF